mmetsp:Transcript_15671/g.39802  ORF Transcript_15671/g.39802 Transcript_15671/m.39802 type:complete len:167 (-) Transcript_15671:750-1250(-)|eukprot:CAMPEP_0113879960 /NCGR_PEP_ID=MMETSP0780_2-20120614/7519_1 /TAXON_ID=652834 /ORGANISM="Palpitomonas bilix" /LENGTH=166 /DNA_ID=CAMNT_0000866581 /DNA_START=142 /DNA_END=642 /DNA_ORIENTATION=+ /assembly_acc=CAM_ASM_000599
MAAARKMLYFFGHEARKCGQKACLSNWYPASFVDDKGQTFAHVEQYMMYQKAKLFEDEKMAEAILAEDCPRACKKYGRQVRGFSEDVWNRHAQDIVRNGCFFKFDQNEKLRKFLLSTSPCHLAEASPFDKVWGIGINEKDAVANRRWRGTNWLGDCLMDVRKRLMS